MKTAGKVALGCVSIPILLGLLIAVLAMIAAATAPESSMKSITR